eukprot:g19780.t1
MRERARSTRARSTELQKEIREAIKKPKACEKLGLWENVALEYNPGDPVAWEVWQGGLKCVGPHGDFRLSPLGYGLDEGREDAPGKARESGLIELDELDKLVGRLTFVLAAVADRALSPKGDDRR